MLLVATPQAFRPAAASVAALGFRLQSPLGIAALVPRLRAMVHDPSHQRKCYMLTPSCPSSLGDIALWAVDFLKKF